MYNNERSIYFDILRCIAMFAVVGVHVFGSILPVEFGGVNWLLYLVVERFNGLGVFFFFGISGYFALKSECGDVKLYYKKRCLRILMPYLVYAFLYTVFLTGVERNDFFGIFWGKDSYVVRLLTANVHGTHWYVYAILVFYMIAPYCNKLLRILSKKEVKILYYGSFLLLALCSLLLAVREWLNVDNLLNIQSIIWLFRVFLMFTTGYIVNEIFKLRFSGIAKWAIGILAFIGYCFEFPLMQYILLFVVMQEGQSAGKRQGLMKKVIQRLAEQSYSIFLIHAAVLSALLRVFRGLEITYWLKTGGLCIMVVMVSFIGSSMVDWLCTKRLIKWGKRVLHL